MSKSWLCLKSSLSKTAPVFFLKLLKLSCDKIFCFCENISSVVIIPFFNNELLCSNFVQVPSFGFKTFEKLSALWFVKLNQGAVNF